MIIGDKYGPVEAPSQIVLEDYEAIRRRITEMADLEFMEKWYKKDTNVIPAIYTLQTPSQGTQ